MTCTEVGLSISLSAPPHGAAGSRASVSPEVLPTLATLCSFHLFLAGLGGTGPSKTRDKCLSLFSSFQLERGDFLSEEWRERIANTRYGARRQHWGLAGQAAFLVAQLDGGGSQGFPSLSQLGLPASPPAEGHSQDSAGQVVSDRTQGQCGQPLWPVRKGAFLLFVA